jgi:hypothetical protein
MEKTIRKHRLPNTDSVEELAGFWDKHDLTYFADELQEVREPVFVRAKGASVSFELPPTEAQRLKRIAHSQGVNESTVLRQWIVEKLHQFSTTRRTSNVGLQLTARKSHRG